MELFPFRMLEEEGELVQNGVLSLIEKRVLDLVEEDLQYLL